MKGLGLIRSSQIKKEESPYKPDPILELFSAILGGHFESENEQKTQQSGATNRCQCGHRLNIKRLKTLSQLH